MNAAHTTAKPSAQLRHLHLVAGQTERITVRSIISALGDNSFALVLLALATLNIVLTPIPGQGTVLSIPMTLVAVQWLRGKRVVTLPPRMAAASLPSEPFRAGLLRALPALLWLEKYCRCRAAHLLTPTLRTYARGTLAVLTPLLIIPIPLTHILPDIAIILIALGELEDDGLMLAGGTVLGLLNIGAFIVLGMMALGGLI